MNEHYENYDMDEMEIDLIDFLFYLLRRWKSLVAMVLLGAVLGSAFCVAKTTKSSNAAVEDYQPDADTEANMKLAAQYRKLYDQQMDYNEHSIVMQMDPNQVYEGTLTYYLVAGEHTELLRQLYMNLINDETVLAEVKAAAGLACDNQYVRELLSVNIAQKDTDDNDNLAKNVVDNIQIISPETSNSNTVLTYRVNYINQETCKKMVEALKTSVDAVKQENKDTYGAYDLNLVKNTVVTTVNQNYLSKQNSSVTLMDNYLTKLVKLEDTFDETALLYYQSVYQSDNQIKEDNLKSEISTGIGVKNQIKWLIIGAFVFGMLCVGYYFLKYLLDSSVKTLDEIKAFQLPVIGYIGKQKDNPTILDYMEEKKNGLYDSIDYVATTIQTLSEEKILFTVKFDTIADKQIGSALEQKITKMKTVQLIQEDTSALEQAKQSDGIIIGVILGKTKRKQVIRELEVCRMQNIKVLGIIGVRAV